MSSSEATDMRLNIYNLVQQNQSGYLREKLNMLYPVEV